MCQLGPSEDMNQTPRHVERSEGLVGYRWCDVGHETGRLFPLTTTNPCWQEPVVFADDMVHYPPTVERHRGSWRAGSTTNGLHIFDTIERAMADTPYTDAYGRSDSEHPKARFVLMKVHFWGLVVDHAAGYRAQYAEIMAVLAPFWRLGHHASRWKRLRPLLAKGNPKLKLRFVSTLRGLAHAQILPQLEPPPSI